MWLAPVPLIVYVLRRPLTRRRVLALSLAGYATWAANVHWFWYIAPVGVALAPLIRLFFWPILAALARKIGGPPFLTIPALWVLLEYAGVFIPIFGFPLNLIGYSQVEMRAFVQIADLGGVFFVDFVMMMFASLVAEKFVRLEPSRAWRAGAIGFAAALALSIVYGTARLATLEIRDGPKILVVQPNIPQALKELVQQQKASPEERRSRFESIFRDHMRVTREGLKAFGPVDLVIWPEAAIPNAIFFDPAGLMLPNVARERLLSAAREFRPAFLTGANAAEDRRFFNSVLLMEGGKAAGRYDKVRLVAFGEYAPGIFRWFVEYFSELQFEDATAGTDFVVWTVKDARIAPAICFEGLFPDISRRLAGKGAQAIVNISNDGWFKSSGQLDQSLAIARFRSIETRVGFVRATNTGISAIIDPAGRVVAKIGGKEVEGALGGRLPLAAASSLYAAVGDLFVLLCAALISLTWVRGAYIVPKSV
jgi:apolipoprotein N-acyltransferase